LLQATAVIAVGYSCHCCRLQLPLL